MMTLAKSHRFNVSFMPLGVAATVFMALFGFALLLDSNMAKAEGLSEEIAIVDIQNILQKSKAAQSIQKQLKDQRKSLQKEFSKFEEELKGAEKELAGQRASLPADEFNKKREKFEERLIKTRSIVQKRKNALDVALKEAMQKLRVEILEIVAGIAEDKGYKLVMSRQNVIIVDKEIDITTDVLKKLDKSLKKVDLDVKVN